VAVLLIFSGVLKMRHCKFVFGIFFLVLIIACCGYPGEGPGAEAYADLFYMFPWEGKSKNDIATAVGLPFSKKLKGELRDYILITADSRWEKEYVLKYSMLTDEGYHFIERSGRSCEVQKGWFVVYNTKTNQGIALMLTYSGNWSMDIRKEGNQNLLTLDTSPSGLPVICTVKGLPMPGALISEFSGHWDYGMRPIKRFIRKNLMRRPGDDWPIVQYNDYFATFGDMNEELLTKAAKFAAEVGCEQFMIDAGWYGVDKDWNILGDWTENTTKFPSGLKAFAETVRGLGMKFGLWVEIESVNINSDIAKQHPEWFLENAQVHTERRVLDFGKKEVLDHVKAVIDNLMTLYKLDYIKMDFNTYPSKSSEGYKGADDPLYGHYKGLLELWGYMRAKYPALIIENCGSGSLRHDLMTAAFTDTHWNSDNIRNHSNLSINYGATAMFPPETCSHWTVLPEDTDKLDVLDVEGRFNVNMMGHFGLSGKIWEWTGETRKIASERIAFYKKIRSIICRSDVYHLTPQVNFDNPESFEALQYAAEDGGQSLVFVFQGNAPSLETKLRLREIDSKRKYRLVLPASVGGKEIIIKGKDLISSGLDVKFEHKGASAIIQISIIKE